MTRKADRDLEVIDELFRRPYVHFRNADPAIDRVLDLGE